MQCRGTDDFGGDLRSPSPGDALLNGPKLVEARMLETNSALLARGMFAALERELRERGLLEWEPELAGRVLEGFVRAIRAAAKAGARYEQADAVYERLCLVDPIAAARLAT